MEHLIIFYSFIVLLTGMVSLAFSINALITSKEKVLKLYLLFFIVFSLTIFNRLLSNYLHYNIMDTPFVLKAALAGTQISLDMLNILCGIIFINELFSAAHRRYINILAAILFVSAIIVFLSPVASHIDYINERIELLSGKYFGFGVYFSGFTYAVVISLLKLKNVKRKKEKIFAIAMVCFLLAGYSEMIFKQAGGFYIKEVDQSLSFYYSTIPYFLWSIFSLYYFRKYYGLYAFIRNDIVLSARFIGQFAITKREQEIILLLAHGLSNQAIGEKLFISVATVKSHVHNILEKTKAKSRMRLLYLVRNIK